jgi:transposase
MTDTVDRNLAATVERMEARRAALIQALPADLTAREHALPARIRSDNASAPSKVPGRFKVIRHVQPKLACMGCQSIFQAAAPSGPIQRGLPGPALLAHVFVGKYCDHTPLYRQRRIYGRDGVEIDR